MTSRVIEQVRDQIATRREARLLARLVEAHLSDAELLAFAVLAWERSLRHLEAATEMGLDPRTAGQALPMLDRVLIHAAQRRGLFPSFSAGDPQPPAENEG